MTDGLIQVSVYTDKNLPVYLTRGWSEDAFIEGRVKTLTGRTFSVTVNRNATVRDLKLAIEDQEGIELEKQELRKGKTKLFDEKKKLSEYWVVDGTVLLLLVAGEVPRLPSVETAESPGSTKVREAPAPTQVVVLTPEASEQTSDATPWWTNSRLSGPKYPASRGSSSSKTPTETNTPTETSTKEITDTHSAIADQVVVQTPMPEDEQKRLREARLKRFQQT